jgi:lactoylglutathione lyase
MQPLGVTSLAHVALRARDIEPMVDFYAKTLGFTEMFRLNQDDGALMLVYLRITDDQYLELFPNGVGDGPAPREAVGLNHLCLAVADLDATVVALAERGVPLTRPLITGRDNNRQVWISDPDGNRVELMEMSPASRQAEAIARLRQQA